MSRYSFIHIANDFIERDFIQTLKTDLLTAGNIPKELKVSDAVVKKAIQQLGIKPAIKNRVPNYFSKDALRKIKDAIKK